MKNLSLNELKEIRESALKRKGYDKETLTNFRSSIRKVSESKSLDLGEMLLDKISKDGRRLNEKTSAVENLILKGANLEVVAQNGFRGLHITSEYDLRSIFYYYVLGGADINAQTTRSLYSACMLSARQGHYEILEDLILLDADLNLRDVEGNTAIMLALDSRAFRAAEMLRDANAILNIKNKENVDARHYGMIGHNPYPQIITQDLIDPQEIFKSQASTGMSLVRKNLEDLKAQADNIYNRK